MSCISEGTIQAYVDNEASQKEKHSIEAHLHTCDKCVKRVEEVAKRSHKLKEALYLSANQIKVKDFNKPKSEFRVRKNRSFKRLIYTGVSVAATFLIIILLTNRKTKPTISDVSFLVYDLELDFNANLPVSEQNLVIHIMDSDGNLIEF